MESITSNLRNSPSPQKKLRKMFKFVVFSALVAVSQANGYGYGTGLGAVLVGPGYAPAPAYAPAAYAPEAHAPEVHAPEAYAPAAYAPAAYAPEVHAPEAYAPEAYAPAAYGPAPAYGPGPLAVHTRQAVSYIPTPSSGYAAPTVVPIDAQSPPVALQYRTFSSPISIQHTHVPSPGSFRATQSQDEPHIRVHTVTKPIIQEFNEIVAPRRFIRQQVLPVHEDVQTVVARQVAAAPALAPVAVARPVAIRALGVAPAFIR